MRTYFTTAIASRCCAFGAIAFVLSITLSMCGSLQPVFSAQLASEYAEPDVGAWYDVLRQPLDPETTCCGDGDAYYADIIETDAAGNLVAVITDTRPNTWERKVDGVVIHGSRKPRPVGERHIIPRDMLGLRRPPNPTGHNVLFVSWSGKVYCFEPLGGV
jgi:hypothetical protein